MAIHQRRLFAQPSPEQKKLENEQKIKEFFYNALVNYVVEHGEFTRENLGPKLFAGATAIIRNILQLSKKSTGIRLPTGRTIEAAECPERYKPLFDILTKLNDQDVTDKALAIVVGKIMAMDSFREMNPSQYLLEAYGLAETVIDNIQYDVTGVTPELIRETFYNEMEFQAVLATQEEWLLLALEDLVDEEGHIYWALPALTILEAVQQSLKCNGIRLLNDKMVNMDNCPPVEHFPAFIKTILTLKDVVKKLCDASETKQLSEDELFFLKHKVACEKPLPERLQQLPNQEELQAIVATIKGMAIEISRTRVFCQTVGAVVRASVEMAKPAAPAPKI